MGFHGGYQRAFHLNRWPHDNNKNKPCHKAGESPDDYDRHCRQKADTELHIVGMTAKAGHVRGYWDFETTKDPKTKKPLHYGFHLTRAQVPSGKSMQYLSINAGSRHWEKSDVAIAEFIMYKGALDEKQVDVFLLVLAFSHYTPTCSFSKHAS